MGIHRAFMKGMWDGNGVGGFESQEEFMGELGKRRR
jgi:hypothetical protein